MKRILSTYLLTIFLLSSNLAKADVYGGGEWEVIGIGNIPCEQFLKKFNKGSFRESISDWVSGFMSGVNYSSKGVYDITNGDDIKITMKLIEKYCEK